jgi:hypothetical protein
MSSGITTSTAERNEGKTKSITALIKLSVEELTISVSLSCLMHL